MTERSDTNYNLLELPINGSTIQIDLAQGRTRPKLGFLGPLGTYSEEAVNKVLREDRQVMDEELLRTNGDVVRKVDSEEFDLGVVAAENSSEGVVMETLRELIHSKNTSILGEIVVPIRHVLIGRSGEEIRQILSHPQALGQCSEYLYSNYQDVELVATNSTAEAVQKIKEIKNAAAIASYAAAERNQMSILAENIGNNPNNATRFLIIGRGETQPTGEDITSIVFVPREDRPGILRDCLDVFAIHGINLTKIDSHPTGNMGQYMFIASLDGHVKDNIVPRALTLLEERYCSSLKTLGSYKKAQLPEGVREPGVINGNGQNGGNNG